LAEYVARMWATRISYETVAEKLGYQTPCERVKSSSYCSYAHGPLAVRKSVLCLCMNVSIIRRTVP